MYSSLLLGAQGKDFSKDHKEHKYFIEAHKNIGINESFYWYISNEVPAKGVGNTT